MFGNPLKRAFYRMSLTTTNFFLLKRIDVIYYVYLFIFAENYLLYFNLLCVELMCFMQFGDFSPGFNDFNLTVNQRAKHELSWVIFYIIIKIEFEEDR